MANEFEAKIIHNFAQDIARKLGEAAVLARTADGYSKQGLVERSFQSLLEIEPLIHEASILLNASSVVRRRDRERVSDFS
ncbi:hypothetical protein [Beijerinckia sp. L45]|uniref:hypothetical protein n=1 Tax=Beijerinckia sp. L45 TaxID=1641855 RepID=UPI00131C7969|nr:hypothetical protein [Beijerinckia sp. L45]